MQRSKQSKTAVACQSATAFLCVEKLSDSLLPTILDEELLRHVYVVVFRICCSQKRRQRTELFSVHPTLKYAILKVSYMRRWYNV